MKRILFVVTLLFIQIIKAQSDRIIIDEISNDYLNIEKALNSYLNGDMNKKYNVLEKSFHPNAMMKYVSTKYGYKEYNALEVFKGDDGKTPEKNRKNKITFIDITGKAASAKLEITYPKITVIDYVSLLKIEGEWKIVSKVFSRKGKEQPDEILIKKTLKNYINGSSYNERDTLKSAFAKNATLYLTGRKGFKRYTPEEYANFFKGKEKGEFNGRRGEILSIEKTKDIAIAKVEISNPKQKWVYIDLFLLKKVDDHWKIISKTATRVK